MLKISRTIFSDKLIHLGIYDVDLYDVDLYDWIHDIGMYNVLKLTNSFITVKETPVLVLHVTKN